MKSMEAAGNEKYIVYADDDQDDHQLLRETLDQLDQTVILISVADGEELFKFLNSLPPQTDSPCLIILDLNMPKIDGLEALKILKSHPRYRNIDVVVFSTSNQPVEVSQAISNGAMDFIKKPVSLH